MARVDAGGQEDVRVAPHATPVREAQALSRGHAAREFVHSHSPHGLGLVQPLGASG
jgi:hypothetical protein